MNELTFITPDLSKELPLDYVEGGIKAGFPSPAQDYLEDKLDLNRDLIEHPAATFYARVDGMSMAPGIMDDDLLVIDRSKEPFDGCVCVCFVNNEFTIKRLDLSRRKEGIIRLVPDNPDYRPIIVREDEDFRVWGVVCYVIHRTV